MMKSSEATLAERAGYLYRRLLLLQRLFQVPDGGHSAEWLDTGDQTVDLALYAGIGDLLEELTEHARILTTIPFPLMEWRPGDGPDDERWRALTEVERRELLSILSGYEKLITWGERVTRQGADHAMPLETPDYLNGDRARIVRFREEMGFLERRIAATS